MNVGFQIKKKNTVIAKVIRKLSYAWTASQWSYGHIDTSELQWNGC